MKASEWHRLLESWSASLRQDPDVARLLPPETIRSRWLGNPPATESQIVQAEQRLGVRLPPSYREFLQVTNGWATVGELTARLWSTAELDWFRIGNRDWIDYWLEGVQHGAETYGTSLEVPDEVYFQYGDEQLPASMRDEYLETALQISDVVDSAVYLLNPQVIAPDGEWEAWFFATWLPGARRDPSFRAMIEDEAKRASQSG
jgi:hypothetical protein